MLVSDWSTDGPVRSTVLSPNGFSEDTKSPALSPTTPGKFAAPDTSTARNTTTSTNRIKPPKVDNTREFMTETYRNALPACAGPRYDTAARGGGLTQVRAGCAHHQVAYTRRGPES